MKLKQRAQAAPVGSLGSTIGTSSRLVVAQGPLTPSASSEINNLVNTIAAKAYVWRL